MSSLAFDMFFALSINAEQTKYPVTTLNNGLNEYVLNSRDHLVCPSLVPPSVDRSISLSTPNQSIGAEYVIYCPINPRVRKRRKKLNFLFALKIFYGHITKTSDRDQK